MGMRLHRRKHTHTHTQRTLFINTQEVSDTAIALIKSCVYVLFDYMYMEKNTQVEKLQQNIIGTSITDTLSRIHISQAGGLFSSITFHYASACIIRA